MVFLFPEEYEIDSDIDEAYWVEVEFVIEYNGEEYDGEADVLVADFDGGWYVLDMNANIENSFFEDYEF